MKNKISANRRPENREDQGMSLHTQNFQSTLRKENDVESTFVLRGSKSAQFLSPLIFLSSTTLEVGLTKNREDPWAKILTTNQFKS
jgi:hypothetical protein